MIAEARCFRAWVNAHLLWCFGHFQTDDAYGILYREELSDMVNVHRDRLSVKDSYQKIFDDLDAAIKDLGLYNLQTPIPSTGTGIKSQIIAKPRRGKATTKTLYRYY